ncbi:MAG: response regulator [bacterium]|nr:response regulator [bacterium]MDZ4286207.1 response regulator [Candidatus Sungbacteria bacterium]
MVEEIKKPKIFVIEDDVFMVELLGNELKNAGLETYSYQTGQTAIDAYAQLQPDLIVLDLLLPDKNGFEVLREIRRLPNGVKVKVMVLSNMAEDADKEEAKRLGVQEYLVKANYSLPEILGKIQVLLLSAVL